MKGRCPKGHNKKFTFVLAGEPGCVACERDLYEAALYISAEELYRQEVVDTEMIEYESPKDIWIQDRVDDLKEEAQHFIELKEAGKLER